MNKKLIIFLDLIATALSVVILLRFVDTDAPVSHSTAPPKNCVADKAAAGPSAVNKDGEAIPSCADLDAVNQSYLKEIRPIFEAKCLMCHGIVKKIPLYSIVPPASWLVQSDMTEAKQHLNMSFDFPFPGKDVDVPQDGLEDLIDVINDNSMPPIYYKAMHWKSGLSQEERQKILAWAKGGLKDLND